MDLEICDKALFLIQLPYEPKTATKIKCAFRQENRSGKSGQMPKMSDYFKADIYQSLKQGKLTNLSGTYENIINNVTCVKKSRTCNNRNILIFQDGIIGILKKYISTIF